jgi:hypothetical protein
MKRPKHGGQRPGAGRPKGKRMHPISLSVTEKQKAFLDGLQKGDASKLIRSLLDDHIDELERKPKPLSEVLDGVPGLPDEIPGIG